MREDPENVELPGSQDLDGAYAFCQKLADEQYQGFPVGTPLMTRRLRRHVAVVYAFTHLAGSFAAAEGEEGGEKLEDWRGQLQALGSGPARHPVFLALEDTVREMDLPLEPFHDLLGAFIQDRTKKRYETYAELLDFCRRSANPVGRVVLMIHGYRDPERMRLSDLLCTALQLTSKLRDIEEDLARDRIYLPLEDFEEFGYTEADLRMRLVNERFRHLIKAQWKRTRLLYEEGRPLIKRLHWPLSWEIKLTWIGGNELLRKVHKQGYDTLRSRPSLSAWDWPRLVRGALFS